MPFDGSMASFVYWLVVVDSVFMDNAAAWEFLTPNCSGGTLVLALGEDLYPPVVTHQ
jgi:hypothetical protein